MHNVEPSPFGGSRRSKQREVPQTIVRSFTLSHELTAPTELRPSDRATTFAARSSRAWEALQLMRTFLLCQKISKFTARTIMQ